MDTNAPSALDPDLATLFLNRRDRALKLPRPGAKTMSLLDYRRRKQGQVVANLAQAAFYRGVIGECQAEIQRMIEEADTPEKRREVLPQAQKLNALAEEAAQQLEKLSDG